MNKTQISLQKKKAFHSKDFTLSTPSNQSELNIEHRCVTKFNNNYTTQTVNSSVQ